MKRMSNKERERRRNRSYHAACEAQYIAAAEKLTNEKMREKALSNAEWHCRRVAELDGEKIS